MLSCNCYLVINTCVCDTEIDAYINQYKIQWLWNFPNAKSKRILIKLYQITVMGLSNMAKHLNIILLKRNLKHRWTYTVGPKNPALYHNVMRAIAISSVSKINHSANRAYTTWSRACHNSFCLKFSVPKNVVGYWSLENLLKQIDM